MPRTARIVIPEVPHNVTQHGNNYQYILKSDTFKKKYIELLKYKSNLNEMYILSYCLMDNHVHFVVIPHYSYSMARTFGQTNMMFSQYYNKITGYKGHVWQDRFYSCPMDREHLYEAIRYVEMNPVRANIVKEPMDYKWSSARGHINKIKDPLITGKHDIVDDIDDWYNYLLNNPDENMMKSIQNGTQKGIPAGDEVFISKIEKLIRKSFKINPVGRPQRQQ